MPDLVIRALNCARLCVVCALKLCPNFGRSRARLCPIYVAPCALPIIAGTLDITVAATGAFDIATGGNVLEGQNIYARTEFVFRTVAKQKAL